MAGHSKWANIKHKKARADAARGKTFTRVSREITVAAKEGGGDPAGNSRLRLLIDKARSVNMPQDNIARAIKKGTGELAGVSYEAMTYEGYGPEGIAVLIDTLTDNKNRTVAELRHIFTKYGGKLAETGSVGWMFEKRGVLRISAHSLTEDFIVETLLDHNIDDVSRGDGFFTVTCPPTDLFVVKSAAEVASFAVESVDVEWVAKDPIDLSEEAAAAVLKFLDVLEESDDIQNVYTNLA